MSRIKVKDRDNLFRDSETGAIICTNSEARDMALAHRNKLKQKDQQLEATVAKVETLSSKVDNIEKMMEQMLALLNKQ